MLVVNVSERFKTTVYPFDALAKTKKVRRLIWSSLQNDHKEEIASLMTRN